MDEMKEARRLLIAVSLILVIVVSACWVVRLVPESPSLIHKSGVAGEIPRDTTTGWKGVTGSMPDHTERQ